MMLMVHVTQAHPGHGKNDTGGYLIVHYLTEPVHLFGALFLGVLVVILVYKVSKSKTRQKQKLD